MEMAPPGREDGPVQPAVFDHPRFPDHQLLDSGNGEKLERFGPVVLRRPDPQALWRPRLEPPAWEGAHLTFVRDPDSRGQRGTWRASPGAPSEATGPAPSAGHTRGTCP